MKKGILQRFELNEYLIQYDPETFSLLCRKMPEGKNIWIRKIEDGGFIAGAVHDEDTFYFSIESGDKSGQFMAVNRADGSTRWIIPGKSYMSQLYDNSLYLIFVDSSDTFYLIKVRATDGSKVWHYRVSEDLYQYKINKNRITLKYHDGKTDIISSESGFLINE